MQYVFSAFIVLALLALAGYFGWKQLQTGRWLRTQPQLPAEDRTYFRRQGYRRYFGCVLAVGLAGLFVGLLVFDIPSRLEEFATRGEEAKARGEANPPMSDEERDFLGFSFAYIWGMIGVALALIVIAVLDLMAIRRYGMRQRRRIRADREAMLQRQLPLLRRDRDGRI